MLLIGRHRGSATSVLSVFWMYFLLLVASSFMFQCSGSSSPRFLSVHRHRRQTAPSTSANSASTTNDTTACPPCTCSNSKRGGGLNFLTVTCFSLNLTSVPETSLLPSAARRLDLSRNNLTWIGPFSFAGLNSLQELILSSNMIEEVDESALNNLVALKELSLSRNQLRQFPVEALRSQRALGLLNLEHNKIRSLDANLFPKSSKLFALLLGHNLIENVDDNAFNSLSSLQILELNDNKLTQVPTALKKLTNLEELTLANNRLLSIDHPFYELIPKIILLEIRGNPLQWIHPEGFTRLRHLKKLILSDVRNLTDFPHLNGTASLEILRIDRCSLTSIPTEICSQTPKLKSLDLKSNRIQRIPQLIDCQFLKVLDLSSNYIQDLGDEAAQFAALSNLHVLHLAQNRVNQINAESFFGLEQLQTLDLSYNNIQDIHAEAFVPLTKLVDLNLGNNFFSKLPSIGLDGIIHLKTFNNPNLREFPGPDSFPRVRTLVLSYAYHCCQFNAHARRLAAAAGHGLGGGVGMDGSSSDASSSMGGPVLQEDVIYPTDIDFNTALSTLNLTDVWAGFGNFSDRGALAQDFINSFAIDPHGAEENYDLLNPSSSATAIGPANPQNNHARKIQCIPQPGPFLPCNDLFDWWTLRCGVWIVFLLALMGNGTVVFVLVFSRTKLDVPRFLVCNLAIADFFMGIYLGFLAVVDAATLGEFRKYAIPWQFSSACQMAGFFGVLSSELSVYTLAVITMERHYAITHAMHLNKRLSLRHATYIMAVGWTFSLVMAVLPLFGVSDYRKFAVCLPFETSDTISLSYVVFLMFANGVAFTILMGCYLKMYCSIRGSQAWNSNDTRIAKRMALLVFTDLLCWAPIAFFSLTAIFGLQLVSLEEAKVFTVFILPFNSCCNPFLYAILTKQFKKDCVLICKAIEESRVTRGIGRCRNSSNFSNRQTAPNTGSLGEKSSRDGQPCICHSGLHPMGDVNGNAKYRFLPTPEGWSRFGPLGRFVSRFILCQNANKDSRQARDDYRMRNVRRYLYTTANVTNFPPDAEKHQRHASVSSDNFSSSRSDSWKAQGRCGIPLRLLEPRRRNSWAVTRKPSQDSSLSNSRNDSSATSNSTATWRLSRSSVSSDATNHSGGGKSSLRKAPTPGPAPGGAVAVAVALPTSCASTSHSHAHALTEANVLQQNLAGGHSPLLGLKLGFDLGVGMGGSALALSSATAAAIPTTGSLNITIAPSQTQASKRPKTLCFNEEAIEEFSTSPAFASTAKSDARKKKQLQQEPATASKSKKPKQKHVKGKLRKNSSARSDSDDANAIIEDDEPSEKIATNRPRLVRQSAFFSDEVVIEPEVCPVHGSLVTGTYDDENDDDDGLVSDIAEDEDEDGEGDEEDDEENVNVTSPILRKPAPAASGLGGSGGGPYVIVESRNRNSLPQQQFAVASTSAGATSTPYFPVSGSLAIAARRLSTISSRDTISLQSIKEDGSSSASGSVTAPDSGAGALEDADAAKPQSQNAPTSENENC